MKVLLVDDDPISRSVLIDVIKQWGHEVTFARNGLEAWELYLSQDLEMIITDWMMPEMDGLELCQRIRARPQASYTYIILISSKRRRVDYLDGMAAGADDFVIKPADSEMLKARLAVGERIIRLEEERKARELILEGELKQAAEVQLRLLPPAEIVLNGLHIYGFMQASSFVGGDMYNVFAIDEKHIGLYFLDVLGHGVSAAFLAITLHHMLEPFTRDGSLLIKYLENGEYDILAPDRVAEKLNHRFCADKSNSYFTFFYGIYDTKQSTLQYVRAGAPYPVYRGMNGIVKELTEGDIPIGIFLEEKYQSHCLQLSQGDQVILASDGLSEWWLGIQKGRKKTSLNDLIAQVDNPLELVKRIKTVLNQGDGPALQDDVSLLILQSE